MFFFFAWEYDGKKKGFTSMVSNYDVKSAGVCLSSIKTASQDDIGCSCRKQRITGMAIAGDSGSTARWKHRGGIRNLSKTSAASSHSANWTGTGLSCAYYIMWDHVKINILFSKGKKIKKKRKGTNFWERNHRGGCIECSLDSRRELSISHVQHLGGILLWKPQRLLWKCGQK